MQWLNIDGRQVPSILPNYWNEQKNDWDITGTKNPLPIANYTQNASGVWLPTSESNPMPTQLTGSNIELADRKLGYEISAGGSVYPVRTFGDDGFKEFFVVVAPQTNHEFEVKVTHGVTQTNVYSDSVIYEVFGDEFINAGRVKYSRKPLPILADYVRIRVRNLSSESQLYDIHLWGVK